MNGFNIRLDNKMAGIQFILDNDYIVSLMATSPSKDKNSMCDKGVIAVSYIEDINAGKTKHLTKTIMEEMNYTPSKEEEDKGCNAFMDKSINDFIDILNFVRNK